MAAIKGQRRPEGAGRKKGTPNAPTKELQDKAKAIGCDPFEVLLHFAKGDWEKLGYESEQRVVSTNEHGDVYDYTIPPSLRQKSAKDAAEYLYPKRKAVEVSGPEGSDPFKTFADIVSAIGLSDGEKDSE